MKLSSTKRIESAELPGVAFTIKKISARRRDEIEDLAEPIAAKMADRDEYAELSREREATVKVGGSLPEEKELRWLKLNFEAARLYASAMLPVIVRYCLVSIEGLEIDEAPATIETLTQCDGEADKLWGEIVRAIEEERGLSPQKAKNSDSLSTSAAPEGGKIEHAESVESAGTTIRSAA